MIIQFWHFKETQDEHKHSTTRRRATWVRPVCLQLTDKVRNHTCMNEQRARRQCRSARESPYGVTLDTRILAAKPCKAAQVATVTADCLHSPVGGGRGMVAIIDCSNTTDFLQS